MTDLRDSLAQVQELLGRATPGGWTVVEDKLPWSFADGRSGMHTQRRICTAWDHPQMQGPIGITNLAIGVGLHDAERKGVQFVSMSREDADAIVAAVAWLREHIPALLAMMEDHSPDAGKMVDDRSAELTTAWMAGVERERERAARDAEDAARYRWLRTVTPYRFKKLQDACIADATDTTYFLGDKFDAAIDAARAGERG